jgi:hypothetical protein
MTPVPPPLFFFHPVSSFPLPLLVSSQNTAQTTFPPSLTRPLPHSHRHLEKALQAVAQVGVVGVVRCKVAQEGVKRVLNLPHGLGLPDPLLAGLVGRPLGHDDKVLHQHCQAEESTGTVGYTKEASRTLARPNRFQAVREYQRVQHEFSSSPPDVPPSGRSATRGKRIDFVAGGGIGAEKEEGEDTVGSSP